MPPEKLEAFNAFFEVYTELSSMGFSPALLWQAERTWKVSDLVGQVCYIEENAITSDLRMYDPNEFSASRLEGFEILTSAIDPRLTEGSLFEICQVSLSEEARLYWKNALNASSFSGGMFEPRAGLIKSNIRNKADDSEAVHGYFFSTEQQIHYIKLSAKQFPDLRTYCPPPMIQCPGDICCDCLDVPRSGIIPPENWEC